MGILFLIATILSLTYMALMLYYRAGWTHLNEHKFDSHYYPKTFVSIVVPARNESNNIGKLLNDLLAQYYPTELLEIIVIDDHSSDDTAEIVKTYKGVQCISLKDYTQGKLLNSYKKKAIEIGIAASKGELIVTTDADCNMNAYWLLSIVEYYEQTQIQLIASPVQFAPILSIFDRFQALDFMTMQGITGAVAQLQIGTMCNGANLAYTKKAFEQVNGFAGIDDIASGDDMLLMYKIEKAFPNQTTFLKCKESIVSTSTMENSKSFFQQRIRWASKATKFKDARIKWVLALVYFYNLIFLILALMSFYKIITLGIFAGFLILKIVVEIYFLKPVASFFNFKNWIPQFMFLQFIHIPYILISGFFGQFGTYTWKNRTVK